MFTHNFMHQSHTFFYILVVYSQVKRALLAPCLPSAPLKMILDSDDTETLVSFFFFLLDFFCLFTFCFLLRHLLRLFELCFGAFCCRLELAIVLHLLSSSSLFQPLNGHYQPDEQFLARCAGLQLFLHLEIDLFLKV